MHKYKFQKSSFLIQARACYEIKAKGLIADCTGKTA